MPDSGRGLPCLELPRRESRSEINIYTLEWARTYPCAELAALPFIVLTFVDSIQPLFTGFAFAFVSYFVSAVGSSHSKQIAWIRKRLVGWQIRNLLGSNSFG